MEVLESKQYLCGVELSNTLAEWSCLLKHSLKREAIEMFDEGMNWYLVL